MSKNVNIIFKRKAGADCSRLLNYERFITDDQPEDIPGAHPYT